ncbi:hypothetical protein T484DRAFT_1833224 [Baffinella frigidus]|nr:hypothetical protein T484DRAFT_1833224 [Cryptophyta sp. CCMP2293]
MDCSLFARQRPTKMVGGYIAAQFDGGYIAAQFAPLRNNSLTIWNALDHADAQNGVLGSLIFLPRLL